MAKTGTHGPTRRVLLTALLGAMVAGLAPGAAFAQDATSRKPGVVQRAAENSKEGEKKSGQQNSRSQSSKRSNGEVISPDNVDPNEQFNLPPNFDPTHRARRTPRNVKVTIDFRQANLEEVVKFFSGAMNINFIVADSLKANKTITIISPTEVTLDEAYRALKPGGHLLWTDFAPTDEANRMRELVRERFEVVDDVDITENVLRAMKKDAARRQAIIRDHATPLLRGVMLNFAAADDDCDTVQRFVCGDSTYFLLRLRKPT